MNNLTFNVTDLPSPSCNVNLLDKCNLYGDKVFSQNKTGFILILVFFLFNSINLGILMYKTFDSGQYKLIVPLFFMNVLGFLMSITLIVNYGVFE